MISQRRWFRLTWTIVYAAFVSTALSSREISLTGEGRYDNVVIGIHDKVTENTNLLNRIQEEITEASKVLLTSTTRQNPSRSGYAFGKVYILIPSTWSTKSEYGKATWQWYTRSQIRIAPMNPAYGMHPYTLQLNGCGQPGLYTHFAPQFFLNQTYVRSRFGEVGKVIVHEWGHLRWGLLDEAPQGDEAHFYVENRRIYPIRCTEGTTGKAANKNTGSPCRIDRNTMLPEKDCIFIPDVSQTGVKASLMAHTYITSVSQFCDAMTADPGVKHNSFSPSRQNRLCDRRCNWDVIGSHEDFLNNTAPAEVDVFPEVHLVQAQKRDVVLVLDLSGSMQDFPLLKLKQAVKHFIINDIEDSASVAMVVFSNLAEVIFEKRLVGPIGSVERREMAETVQKMVAVGKTDIGDGLVLGVETLNRTGGGFMFLVSDGEEDRSSRSKYNYTSAVDLILKNGVTVDVLALGPEADRRIGELARITGGKFYHAVSNKNSYDLISGLSDSVSERVPAAEAPINILTTNLKLAQGKALEVPVKLDSSAKGQILFYVQYTGDNSVNIIARNPDGVRYTNDNSTYEIDTTLKTVYLRLNATEYREGTWTLVVQPTTNSPFKSNLQEQEIAVVISAKADNADDIPTTLVASIDSVEVASNSPTSTVTVRAVLTKGQTPITTARVKATVTRPIEESIDFELHDNGLGKDLMKGDGVYTGILSSRSFNKEGDYSVRVIAESATTVLSLGHLTSEDTLISRSGSAGSFHLNSFNATQAQVDEVPPARLEDFHIRDVNSSSQTATLEWTAVGDDYNEGQARFYTIKWSNDYQLLVKTPGSGRDLSQSDVIQGNLSSPLTAGGTEVFRIKLPKEDDVIYLIAYATDAAGNTGEASFPAAATTVILPFARTSPPVGPEASYTGLIVGLVVGGLVFLVVVGMVAYFFRYRRH